ncbi:hypothetical protein DFH27DRAFT_199429 [Peziza echinospora]|nr:hypothetical protein DFH27DRAFT_199429 [Peziza echinospora]
MCCKKSLYSSTRVFPKLSTYFFLWGYSWSPCLFFFHWLGVIYRYQYSTVKMPTHLGTPNSIFFILFLFFSRYLEIS